MKLGIKPGHTVYPIDPPGNYAALVGGLPDGATLAGTAPADVVHVFARTAAELTAGGQRAVAAVRPGGLVWVSYPKGGRSELKRDMLREAIPGWSTVMQVAVDEQWSALRFRPDSEVGT